jgi:hypothetical protein
MPSISGKCSWSFERPMDVSANDRHQGGKAGKDGDLRIKDVNIL